MNMNDDFQLLSSMLFDGREYFLLDLHLARVKRSCEYFGWTQPNLNYVKDRLRKEARSFGVHPCKIRMIYSKEGSVVIEHSSIVPSIDLLGPFGASCNKGTVKWTVYLETQSISRISRDYLLNKTTRRDHYNEPTKRLQTSYAQHEEVLLYNDADEITEGTITNVAVHKSGRWITPPASVGCLNGVMRQYLLQNSYIVEGHIQKQDLSDGMPIALFNAVRGAFLGRLRIHRAKITHLRMC